MLARIPERVAVVELENAPFRCAKAAFAWARSHGVIGLMSDVDTNGKGEISISAMSIRKMLSGSALGKSVTPAIHLAALMRVRDIIRESFVFEVHPDYLKVSGRRAACNGVNRGVQIAVLYGCVALGQIPYRAKTTLKLHDSADTPTKAYSYEISAIEILAGNVEPGKIRPGAGFETNAKETPRGNRRAAALPNDGVSMDTHILLNGVVDVNGVEALSDRVELGREKEG